MVLTTARRALVMRDVECLPVYVTRTSWGYSLTLSRELAATGAAWAEVAWISGGWEAPALLENAEWAAEQLERRPADPKTREVKL